MHAYKSAGTLRPSGQFSPARRSDTRAMECLKTLLCCAASLAAIAARGRAAPQFGQFAFQNNKRSLAAPNVGLNGLASPFNDFGTPFDFGGGRTGFPAADFDDAAGGLIPQLPPTADLAGFTGFPSAGFPSVGFPSADFGTGFPQNQLVADGFAAPGLADFPALPADFGRSFSPPQVPAQPLQPPSEPPRLQSDRQSSAAAEETTSASNPKAPATAYDNDGINTTPSPPPGVPDLVLDLMPPPYSPQPNPSQPYSSPPPQAGPENPSPAADDFDSVPTAALLPGRPFDYGAAPRPFAPAPGSPGGRPVNAVASFGPGMPTANAAVLDGNAADRGQLYTAAASAPQTYATSVSTTPVGGGGSADRARPPPAPFAAGGNQATSSPANHGRMPVVVVYGGGSNAHSASSYGDANAVRNSFDEIAGILSGIVKSVPGELVGDSNGSISANGKRESSSGGDVRSPAFRYPDDDGEYKRD